MKKDRKRPARSKAPVIISLVIMAVLLALVGVIAKVVIWDGFVAPLNQKMETMSWVLTMAIYLAICLPPLASLYFVMWAYRKRHPRPEVATSEEAKKPPKKVTLSEMMGKVGSWIYENTLFTLLAFFLCGVILITVAPNWFWERIWADGRIWVLIGVAIAFALMIPKGVTPLHHRMGRIGLPVTLLVIAIVLFGKPLTQYVSSPPPPTSRPARIISSQSDYLPRNLQLGLTTVKDYFQANLPAEDAVNLLLICREESGWNQFDVDGTPYHRDSPDDIGICQINRPSWPEELKDPENNIDTLEGNLRMAVYIYRKHGPSKWSAWTKVQELLAKNPPTTITVPATGTSEAFLPDKTRNCIGFPKENVRFLDDRGNSYEIILGKPLPAVRTRTLRYESLSGAATTVTIQCV